jgi:hypothetical protein
VTAAEFWDAVFLAAACLIYLGAVGTVLAWIDHDLRKPSPWL